MKESLLNTAGNSHKPQADFNKVFFYAKKDNYTHGYSQEQNADSAKDHLVRKSGGIKENSFFKANPVYNVQRKCTKCEEEEKLQRKEEMTGQIKADNELENYIGGLNSGGEALPENARRFFEPRFGYDFSNVRIHNDSAAADSASSVNALAYTSGNNIVFNKDRYAPDTDSGKKLLSHELTHVIQQGSSLARKRIQKAEDKNSESTGKLFEETFSIQSLIEDGKLIEEPAIMGKEFVADCESYSVTFKFPKAYKGLFYSNVPGLMFKGVYVNLEAHYMNKSDSGRCSPLRFLQVLRYFKLDESGLPVSTEPTSPANKILSGWGQDVSSEGWFVDTLTTNPFYTSSAWGMEGSEGTENSPAILWDAPSNLDYRNHGKEFYTCAVCENEFDKTRSIDAYIKWGYFIDSNLHVSFYPAEPQADCSVPQVVIDATGRWDQLEGLQKTGITF